ncbi:MAG: hypothetical protein VW397_05690, partial [Candidatus Margulisiibacteriota bacterium]
MKILISIHSLREMKTVFQTPFFQYLKEDKSNDYVILTSLEILIDYFSRSFFSNISVIEIDKINRFKNKVISMFFLWFEYLALIPQKTNDQKIFFDRLKNWEKKKYRKAKYINLILRVFPLSFYKMFFQLFLVNKKIKEINPDRVFLTSYFIPNEFVIMNNFSDKQLFFFPDSWDVFTKHRIFLKIPKKIMLWNHNMYKNAIGIEKISKTNLIITGNPFWDTLKKHSNNHQFKCNKADKSIKNVLIFSSNMRIYNELDILKELYDWAKLNSNICLNIRTSVLENPKSETNKKYMKKELDINKIFENKNVFVPKINDQNLTLKDGMYFDKQYLDLLIDNDIFVTFGAST